ncbi:hypothetical protein K432DRAFT_394863 [Lepidopterella palustris CBS 459.81]|uniref:MYND-type domain-containing protein n=1 Tax=Lepidopterella palustris CBS 459.81 TaxID=1314670 RepID=A0A8E2JDG3_9PEZI|nr:hypothetical protein K432DRAFT_394863 [Lepidopterella palustris CBS 459.81]
MATPSTNSVHTQEVLSQPAEWLFRDSIRISRDLGRYCKPNTAIEFTGEDADVSFCLLVSAGCSHIASVEACPSKKTIKVSVFKLHEGFEQIWTVTYSGPDGEFQASSTRSWYDSAQMHGGITEDGQSVSLVYRPGGGPTTAYIVNASGFTSRKPPSDTGTGYSSHSGMLSADSEHLCYTRSGSAFGKGGEAKVVEVYSIRHLARVRAVTIAFGDGRHLRNTRLIKELRAQGTIYMAIDTSSFDGDDAERNSPPLIASSDKKLAWNFEGIDEITTRGGPNIFISHDDKHLCYVGHDTAMLNYWDLQNPTLRPLGSVRLPGVEYSQSRRWLIYGKETTMNDSIKEQLHHARYSPGCSVVTIITVTDSTVIINVLLTFNLQLIYHKTVSDPKWAGCLPVRIGFNDFTGLNIVAMYPTALTDPRRGPVALFGVQAILFSLPDIFKTVKSIETYFDSTANRIATLKTDVAHKVVEPEYRFSWKPGVTDRNDENSLELEKGQPTSMTDVDRRRQQEFYDRIFSNPKSSVRMNPAAELRQFFVPHLFSFTYPWAPDQTVSVFGVIMKNEYHIITIGPAPSSSSPALDIIRALYATDIKISGDSKEFIEIYKLGTNYALYVSKKDRGNGSYSGAPMPIPRCTVISPHFLEEDAWYDIFIFHRAAHVTMPTGWISTPNPALTNTANFHAFFEPGTFTRHGAIDYGHRARSAHVAPKYLLWQEYGLRGLRKPTTNDIFFGGGQYADIIGYYLRSIYQDKCYDDSNPLFPSTFALACYADHRTQKTVHVDAFFRRLHQSKDTFLDNSRAVACTLPLACRTRPVATLSFARHIALYQHKINDVGPVEVKKGTTKPKQPMYNDSRWSQWLRIVTELWWLIMGLYYYINPQDAHPVPNVSRVTLPLPGFCSFHCSLYKAPPVSGSGSSGDNPFWEFIRATYPSSENDALRRETQTLVAVQQSSMGPTSPFTRLVQEILDLKDRDTQLSFLRVVWLEKLLAWKMHKFGMYIYLTRTALPMLLLFIFHLAIGILFTRNSVVGQRKVPLILLACFEATVAFYILFVKIRQLVRIPRLFVRSLFNYLDLTAVCLGFTTFFLVILSSSPPRAFLGFSTLLLWMAAVLTLRIYRPVGMLLLLLTETLQGVFSFLVLLFFIIMGFAFVPFLLLRNLEVDRPAENPFSSFSLTISQMLNFITSDYGALEPFQESSAAVRTLRATYIIIITILFLNMLIAILNLRMKTADKNAENLYHLQMASLQVEIEIGLLSSSERANRDWFPEWFSYVMTETEKRNWNDYVDKNPIKWTEENDFGYEKEHAPQKQAEPVQQKQPASVTAPASASSAKPQQETKGISSQQENHQTRTSPKVEDDDNEEDWVDKPDQPVNHENTSLDELLSYDAGGAVDKNEGESNQVNEPASSTSIQDPPASTYPCKVCGQPGLRCTSCYLNAYCGREHQKLDWKNHKRACKGKGRA